VREIKSIKGIFAIYKGVLKLCEGIPLSPTPSRIINKIFEPILN